MSQESPYQKSNINRLSELPNSHRLIQKLCGIRQGGSCGRRNPSEDERTRCGRSRACCSYCIDIHVNNAKKPGVSKEELAETIMVAADLRAESVMAHGVNALNTYDEK